MKVKSLCDHCSNPFQLDADSFLKFKGNFCSSQCGSAFRKLAKKKTQVVKKTVIKTVIVEKTKTKSKTSTVKKQITEEQIDFYCWPARNETIAVNKI